MHTRLKHRMGRVAAHGAVTVASALLASPMVLLIGYAVTYLYLQR